MTSPTPKRPYRIDPVVAHERARRGAAARNAPDTYIRQLAAATLTTEQKRRLAELLMPFLAETPEVDDAATGHGGHGAA
jgi:hypothetical protein